MQTMTRKEFAHAMEDAEFRDRFAKSWSPGPVADALKLSRQRIHELLTDGKIASLRVVNDDGSLAWINVFEDAVRAYLRDSKRAAAKRINRLDRLLQSL